MLGLLINILHLVLASALSLIGIEYERDAGCDPVRFETVAYYELTETTAAASAVFMAPPAAPAPPPASGQLRPATGCGGADAPARPRLGFPI